MGPFDKSSDIYFARVRVGGKSICQEQRSRLVPMIPGTRQLLERLSTERPIEAAAEPVMKVRECQKAIDRAAKNIEMQRLCGVCGDN